MKLLIIVLLFPVGLFAQSNLGFFIEGGANAISINQDAGINANFSANFLIKKKFYTGLFYERLVTHNNDLIPPIDFIPVPNQPLDTSRYFNQSSGLKLGFIILPKRLISISPDVMIGYSNVFWETARNRKHHYLNVTPSLKAMIRFAKVFRFGVSVNFRYYTEIDINQSVPEISSKRLGGLGGGLFLRIGKF